MKSEAEKKIPTSIRLSQNERRIVEEKARKKGMTLTHYIADMAVHGEETLSPKVMVQIQNLINHIYEVANQAAPDEVLSLQKEANALWSML